MKNYEETVLLEQIQETQKAVYELLHGYEALVQGRAVQTIDVALDRFESVYAQLRHHPNQSLRMHAETIRRNLKTTETLLQDTERLLMYLELSALHAESQFSPEQS